MSLPSITHDRRTFALPYAWAGVAGGDERGAGLGVLIPGHWVERTFEGGALKDTRRLTGLFSLVITSPRTVDAVRKNPLGIYVHAFNWSQDVTSGEPK